MDKTCRTCKKTKPESEYSIASSGKKGANFRNRNPALKTQCKACDAAYAREFRKRNKNYTGTGKIKDFPNKYLASAISLRLHDAKQRSRKLEIPINVDKKYLYDLFNEQEGKCVYTGQPLLVEPNQLQTLSLDKIDPSLGYTKGNVQWVSWAVNRAKGEMSHNEFLNMCRVITEKCND